MADTVLTLDGAPKTITLSMTTVSRIVVPKGTRYLVVSCGSDWYQQVVAEPQTVADGAAITAADAMLMPAGILPLVPDGDLDPTSGKLLAARYAYVYGSAVVSLYVRAVSSPVVP